MNTLILAIDLGKFKSVACRLDDSGHRFETILTSPQTVHDLLVRHHPSTLVIEACSISGWVCDIARALSIEVQVANANAEAWHYKRVKRKTDRDDALKLARMCQRNEIPCVHIPLPRVRQWKALIKYRHALIDRRTGIKNTIRAVLDAQGIAWAGRSRGWTKQAIAELKLMARPLDECDELNLWRGELSTEIELLEVMSEKIKHLDAKLDALQATNVQVHRLRTIPQVGARLAELIVATIDDAKRFKNAQQVSAYAGLVPKQFQSGQMEHLGRITGRGPKLLRRVLVQVAWGMQRREGRGKVVFQRLCHGQTTRRKQAVVGLARKILVWCWAMMRDESTWDEQKAQVALSPATA